MAAAPFEGFAEEASSRARISARLLGGGPGCGCASCCLPPDAASRARISARLPGGGLTAAGSDAPVGGASPDSGFAAACANGAGFAFSLARTGLAAERADGGEAAGVATEAIDTSDGAATGGAGLAGTGRLAVCSGLAAGSAVATCKSGATALIGAAGLIRVAGIAAISADAGASLKPGAGAPTKGLIEVGSAMPGEAGWGVAGIALFAAAGSIGTAAAISTGSGTTTEIGARTGAGAVIIGPGSGRKSCAATVFTATGGGSVSGAMES